MVTHSGKSQLCCFPAAGPGATDSTSRGISFFIFKMELITVPTSGGCMKLKLIKIQKTLRIGLSAFQELSVLQVLFWSPHQSSKAGTINSPILQTRNWGLESEAASHNDHSHTHWGLTATKWISVYCKCSNQPMKCFVISILQVKRSPKRSFDQSCKIIIINTHWSLTQHQALFWGYNSPVQQPCPIDLSICEDGNTLCLYCPVK